MQRDHDRETCTACRCGYVVRYVGERLWHVWPMAPGLRPMTVEEAKRAAKEEARAAA